MKDEPISYEAALENVLIMAERLAFLHFAFAKTMEEELGTEKANVLTLKAIDEYGKMAAKAATKKITEQGLPITLKNYRAGKDLPSLGWKSAPTDLPEEKPYGKCSKVSFCPLAAVWKNLGKDGERLGRLYCWVDQAKYRAYGKGYKCFHDKNVLDGDEFCLVRVELEGPEDE